MPNALGASSKSAWIGSCWSNSRGHSQSLKKKTQGSKLWQIPISIIALLTVKLRPGRRKNMKLWSKMAENGTSLAYAKPARLRGHLSL